MIGKLCKFSMIMIGTVVLGGCVTDRTLVFQPGLSCPGLDSDYGSSTGISGGTRRSSHNGWDTAKNLPGYPVITPSDVVVSAAGPALISGNKVVMVVVNEDGSPARDPDGNYLVPVYSHLKEFSPRLEEVFGNDVNGRVRLPRGAQVGTVGGTGRGNPSGIPHLHSTVGLMTSMPQISVTLESSRAPNGSPISLRIWAEIDEP
jgi:murein DD-endopeptidase MepM/ murein hydrolase activator NlpD